MKTKKANSNRKSKPHTPRFTGRNPSRERLEPIAYWEAEVKVEKQGKKNAALRRKVQTRGVIKFKASSVLNSMMDALLAGYEVRLVDDYGDDAIRLFPCLDANYEKMFVAAQTMGIFRRIIEQIPFRMEHCGEEVNPQEYLEDKIARQWEIEKKREKLAVTPDTMVSCPKCGTTFRVGRKLEEN